MRSVSLWTSAAIAEACQGTAHGDFMADGVTFDSREVVAGDLFIALKGEATDGHRFVGTALQRGAAGLLVSEALDAPHVRVADTMAALNALGAAARDRSSATRIGVTGSVGKTGVKEALKAALSRFAPDAVHASVKSYNNHTGVPLSLSRMPAASRFGVFEMGMNHSGELAELTQLVRPHIAIVTWVASAHREFFATETDIAMAKAEIFAGLPAGGTAIIPHDSSHADQLARAAADAGAKVVRFGMSDGADVRAEKVALHPDCSCVTARIGSDTLTFKIGMAGQHWVNNALAVLAGVQAAGGDLALAGLALAELNDLPGRGRRLRVAAGAGQAIVIDEAYNANPASMAASLAVLKAVAPARHGRRLALLGSMKELGTLSDEFHAGLAPHIRDAGVAAAVLVGAEMQPLAATLGRSIDVRHVADADAARTEISRLIAADDVLLVKGSNSIGLARVIEALASGDMMP
ncbi:UDP-N-acetylmuramoyl-tripeptide--D-alanyl-D-alanine ligase [Sandarakinorhabdus sp.]|uniref:UDP-N-acetylmuramoyl-tripeptide--D-alanyl-D- alanine ligase n=1 Tax=Sandarakinorhabdus sp. TaxID=1916663 RepID=UPI0028AF8BD8|nr:UDP-N-acetylmuramoyl-tripeptide--D-alanyl-D-alanine ligase [Sandarakinorhabdus sp.]